MGSIHFLWERSDGSPIIVAGPMWPFCMFVTVPLVAGLSALVLYFCIVQENAPLVSRSDFFDYFLVARCRVFNSWCFDIEAFLGSLHLCTIDGCNSCGIIHGFLSRSRFD